MRISNQESGPHLRILFTSIVGTGHLLPLLPYAQEMVRQGHDVRIAAPAEVARKILEAGLTHMPTARPDQAERDAFFSSIAHLPPDDRRIAYVRGFFVGLLARRSYPGLRRFAEDWRPDLIVRESGEFAGPLVGAKLGIPHVRVSVLNGHPMRTEAPAFDSLLEAHGLAADGGAGLRQARAFSAFPASMEPPNGDAAVLPQFRVAPVWPPPSGARPTWVSGPGEPHIYMTFGTVIGSMDKGKAVIRAAVDAIGALGVRTLMTTGATVDVSEIGEIPDTIVVKEFVPQHEIFPHVDAVLCHGGSGSVLGALAAGLPLVIIPVAADQPDNAASVAARGAGIAVDTPEAGAVAQALHHVLSDPAYAVAARHVAAEMASHPSIAQAVAEMLRHGSAACA